MSAVPKEHRLDKYRIRVPALDGGLSNLGRGSNEVIVWTDAYTVELSSSVDRTW